MLLFFAWALPSRAADAPYVTTPQNVIDAMLKISAVAADDYLIDLGSGDGRIVITAAKQFGTRGMGVELDPNLVRTATREAQREGVQERVSFHRDDLFFADLSKATVITMYMSEAVNLRLRSSLFKLKPGTRVVSHDFDMGNWQPDAKLTVAVPGKRYGPPRSDIFLWVIPADFSGNWSWRVPLAGGGEAVHEAVITQKFQHAQGSGRMASHKVLLSGLAIRGDFINFLIGVEIDGKGSWREFQGRIDGDTISGTAVTIADADKVVPQGPAVPWRAVRTARGNRDIEAGAKPFGSGFFTKEQQ
jgi:hypothetical protein